MKMIRDLVRTESALKSSLEKARAHCKEKAMSQRNQESNNGEKGATGAPPALSGLTLELEKRRREKKLLGLKKGRKLTPDFERRKRGGKRTMALHYKRKGGG